MSAPFLPVDKDRRILDLSIIVRADPARAALTMSAGIWRVVVGPADALQLTSAATIGYRNSWLELGSGLALMHERASGDATNAFAIPMTLRIGPQNGPSLNARLVFPISNELSGKKVLFHRIALVIPIDRVFTPSSLELWVAGTYSAPALGFLVRHALRPTKKNALTLGYGLAVYVLLGSGPILDSEKLFRLGLSISIGWLGLATGPS